MKLWTLEWQDTRTGERAVCETDGDVAYEVHRTEEAAQAAADLMNDDASGYGWNERYSVVELPHGLRPYFGGEQPDPPYYG